MSAIRSETRKSVVMGTKVMAIAPVRLAERFVANLMALTPCQVMRLMLV